MRIFMYVAIAVISVCYFQACVTDAGPVPGQKLTNQQIASLDTRIELGLVYAPDNQARLKINISFVMPLETLYLQLPSTFLRKERLYERIEDLSVSKSGVLFADTHDPAYKKIQYPVGQRVEISYLYRPDDPVNYKGFKESASAPIIKHDYFQFIGMMAFVFPYALINAHKEFDVTFMWSMPADFSLYNSFGAQQNRQKVKVNFDQLRDSLFIGGRNLRTYNADVRGNPVAIVFEGQSSRVSDNNYIDTVVKLLTEQRKTWSDDDFPYYLVHFLLQNKPCNGGKLMGTAHTSSFRAVLPGGCDLGPEIRQLISHELMHAWIGKKIKVGQERAHIDGKWFTEGVTDYYGRLLAYRAGVLSENEYFKTLNNQLEKYYNSNEKASGLRELVERMYRRNFSNRALESLPYQQGEIIALNLNKKIKKNSLFKKSMDDVIRDMLGKAKDAGGTKNFSPDEISNIADRYEKGALEEEIQKIKDGDLFIAPTLPLCRAVDKRILTYINQPSRVVYFYGRHLTSCDQWLN